MTPFHHESRPRLANGLPCWLGTNIALPSVDLRCEPPEKIIPVVSYDCPLCRASYKPLFDATLYKRKWTVLVMVGGYGGSSWAIREMSEEETFGFLRDWVDGPEEALKRWFDREPPSGTSRGPLIEDELVAGPGTNKTAEDLGL